MPNGQIVIFKKVHDDRWEIAAYLYNPSKKKIDEIREVLEGRMQIFNLGPTSDKYPRVGEED